MSMKKYIQENARLIYTMKERGFSWDEMRNVGFALMIDKSDVPYSIVSSGHFRSSMHEVKNKEAFRADEIFDAFDVLCRAASETVEWYESMRSERFDAQNTARLQKDDIKALKKQLADLQASAESATTRFELRIAEMQAAIEEKDADLSTLTVDAKKRDDVIHEMLEKNSALESERDFYIQKHAAIAEKKSSFLGKLFS
jgi:hypothetical protein